MKITNLSLTITKHPLESIYTFKSNPVPISIESCAFFTLSKVVLSKMITRLSFCASGRAGGTLSILHEFGAKTVTLRSAGRTDYITSNIKLVNINAI